MRAPVGQIIRNKRKYLRISQAALARKVEISASYLNLIEANKRDVGGTLLRHIADALDLDLDQLSGEAEQRLIHELIESFADPVFEGRGLRIEDAREIVAQMPGFARAFNRLYRAYSEASTQLETQTDRLKADPLFSEILHQLLSRITAVRSSAEILDEVKDLSLEERQRFSASVSGESRAASDVAQTLIRHFDQSAPARRAYSGQRELDEFIAGADNFFPELEEAGTRLRYWVEEIGPFSEAALAIILKDHHQITVKRGSVDEEEDGPTSQFRFVPDERVMWFKGSATASTRQFQLARLLAELHATDSLQTHSHSPLLTSETARKLAYRAGASYVAGATVFPYERFFADASRSSYDVDYLAQAYTASFEQVAHRLVSLRQPGMQGIPFGFLRSDPAGRLTKRFPLPGLLLPNTGHACPLWAVFSAFRSPSHVVRQTVRFDDGSRYLFVAKADSKRLTTFRDQPFHSSVMLACDILDADKTIYGQGLNLDDTAADVLVGPSCRLCVRRECPHRQEAMVTQGQPDIAVHTPLVPSGFKLGEAP